jgi:tricorn protease
VNKGYFRYPTLFADQVAFTSEDDIWLVPLSGGIARRLTAGLGASSRPHFSPDGKKLAFSSAEEGALEVFIMPAEGGEVQRLTYLANQSHVVGWQDNETVFFASPAFEPHLASTICRIATPGGLPESLRLGPAVNISFNSGGPGVVLERNSSRADPAHWKRYRGGTAGKLWYAESLEADFRPLINLNGNLARPMFAKSRIYFVSDHEGIGNLYSCLANGQDLRVETKHKDFYVRNPSTDGKNIVYHAGADLYFYNLTSQIARKIDFAYNSQRTQRQRRFVATAEHLEWAALSPDGENLALTARGQVHALRNWDGPVTTRREPAARLRLAQYLHDGARLVIVTDKDSGDEQLEIYNLETHAVEHLSNTGWGRFTDMMASPKNDKVAFANHRNELWIVDLKTKTSLQVARNAHWIMTAFSWSPDGRWLAFSLSESWNRSAVCVANAETAKYTRVTEPLFHDFCPSFDPDGRYLYFLSQRELNPVYDGLQFDLSFPKGILPCLVTLQKTTPSPFLQTSDEVAKAADKTEKKDLSVEIEFDGITKRLLAFPMPEARYQSVIALNGKVLLTHLPVEGSLYIDWRSAKPDAKAELEVYDFAMQKVESLIKGVTQVSISNDRSSMLLRVGSRLRVLKAGDKPADAPAAEPAGRKNGWIDLERAKTLVEPGPEWLQMTHEAWRLQRDHYWREDMSKIKWNVVLQRYLPLVERLTCRSEFADLVWELQGELGTSHAYDMGGDYRTEPSYPVGLLGADFSWTTNGYRIENLLPGDPWKKDEACPLSSPGVLLEKGDTLTSINGQKLTRHLTPHQGLLHLAGSEVEIEAETKVGPRKVRVRTLAQEASIRYRGWVEHNREHVRKVTRGRIGYIHIPDMGPRGFSEFHRHFLRDFDQDGLIVDVRYNGGGHVSQLLLEKLCRKRMGADVSRWFGTLPFPDESPAGPMVALTNEYAGSDGDIFSHSFKYKKAGPLIGRRTWGGVIGILPRHRLVDGGLTTQPEYSHWFADVGFAIENYGTDPDIDVDIAPHQYRRGQDPQLDRGIAEVMKLLEISPPFRPVIDKYPDLGFNL